MPELLTRDRSPRTLLGAMFLAWVIAIGTSQVEPNGLNPLLRAVMLVVMVVALVVAAVCLVKLLLHAFSR